MFNNSGLSLEQAPPIKVVLRFFLSGSIFGVIFSLYLLLNPNILSNLYSSQALIATHLFTLGVMASFMFGALFQMLPVICGVAIKKPTNISLKVNYFLIFGVIFLLLFFNFGSEVFSIFSIFFLAITIFTTAFIMIKELIFLKHNNSSRGMLLSLFALVFVAIFGIILVIMRSGYSLGFDYENLKYIHFSFGIFGWIALLIISVSFQVIEMFYVTKAYNKNYAKYLPIAILTLLILNIFFGYKIFDYITAFLISIHALLTISRLKNKKRALSDATVYFWFFGMGLFILFFISFIFGFLTLAAIFYIFFALSVVFAMSYKIVPFLVWFHLNAKGYFDAPMMHEVASLKYAKINFYFFVASFALLISSVQFTILWQIGSFSLFISFLMLLLMIYNAWHKYQYVLENGKRFEFNY